MKGCIAFYLDVYDELGDYVLEARNSTIQNCYVLFSLKIRDSIIPLVKYWEENNF